jgi:hypothetical protein
MLKKTNSAADEHISTRIGLGFESAFIGVDRRLSLSSTLNWRK